jgi:predicted alpha/beta hydrolase
MPDNGSAPFQAKGTGPAVNARHVIITAHGIRTFGQWQDRLAETIRTADPEVRILNYRYGYFSSVAFLIPPLRMLETRKFRVALEAELALHPDARVDLVGHSFGTHLIGHGLRRIPRERRPKVHTVLLAGSVLRPDFRWCLALTRRSCYFIHGGNNRLKS